MRPLAQGFCVLDASCPKARGEGFEPPFLASKASCLPLALIPEETVRKGDPIRTLLAVCICYADQDVSQLARRESNPQPGPHQKPALPLSYEPSHVVFPRRGRWESNPLWRD
jgi:hypothetical protein